MAALVVRQKNKKISKEQSDLTIPDVSNGQAALLRHFVSSIDPSKKRATYGLIVEISGILKSLCSLLFCYYS